MLAVGLAFGVFIEKLFSFPIYEYIFVYGMIGMVNTFR